VAAESGHYTLCSQLVDQLGKRPHESADGTHHAQLAQIYLSAGRKREAHWHTVQALALADWTVAASVVLKQRPRLAGEATHSVLVRALTSA
jgi:hypothetical protein